MSDIQLNLCASQIPNLRWAVTALMTAKLMRTNARAGIARYRFHDALSGQMHNTNNSFGNGTSRSVILGNGTTLWIRRIILSSASPIMTPSPFVPGPRRLRPANPPSTERNGKRGLADLKFSCIRGEMNGKKCLQHCRGKIRTASSVGQFPPQGDSPYGGQRWAAMCGVVLFPVRAISL